MFCTPTPVWAVSPERSILSVSLRVSSVFGVCAVRVPCAVGVRVRAREQGALLYYDTAA